MFIRFLNKHSFRATVYNGNEWEIGMANAVIKKYTWLIELNFSKIAQAEGRTNEFKYRNHMLNCN